MKLTWNKKALGTHNSQNVKELWNEIGVFAWCAWHALCSNECFLHTEQIGTDCKIFHNHSAKFQILKATPNWEKTAQNDSKTTNCT